MLENLVGGTVTASTLTGQGLDEVFSRTDSSGTSSLLTDSLGTTVGLGNSSGTVPTTYTYDPYGSETTSGTSSANPFEFVGQQNDGTGLDYDQARYYSPSEGRFISQDPLGLTAGVVTCTRTLLMTRPISVIRPESCFSRDVRLVLLSASRRHRGCADWKEGESGAMLLSTQLWPALRDSWAQRSSSGLVRQLTSSAPRPRALSTWAKTWRATFLRGAATRVALQPLLRSWIWRQCL